MYKLIVSVAECIVVRPWDIGHESDGILSLPYAQLPHRLERSLNRSNRAQPVSWEPQTRAQLAFATTRCMIGQGQNDLVRTPASGFRLN